MMKKKYSGVIVPVVTPLTSDYKLDQKSVELIFENLYRNKVSPFFLGTTGESPSLPFALKKEYLALVGKIKQPGSLLYAGISSNCVEESIELAKRCFDSGVDAVAATLPSYYILTESQMKKYYETLVEEINGPLIIYNFPSATNMSIPLTIIEELSYHENIVATKDSERGESRLNESSSLWSSRQDFSHFLGWTAKASHALLNGTDGLIPGTGNLCPNLYASMVQAVLDADQEEVFRLQYHSDLLETLYLSGRTFGESLSALKILMNDYGLCGPNVMPPLQPLPEPEERRLKHGLKELIEREGIQIGRARV